MQNRAYSTMEIKGYSDDGSFTGIASTPSVDRVDDIMVASGAEYKLPLPFLLQHDHDDPIGLVTAIKVTAKGLEIAGKIMLGVTKEIDEAFAKIKAGLIRGLSIGFRGLESIHIEGTYGRKYTKWELFEISAVTVPANAECSISSIKSIDKQFLPNSDAKSVRLLTPSDLGTKSTNQTAQKELNMKTVSEQIVDLEATIAAKSAEANTIMQKSIAEGRSTDANEADQFDTLEGEIAGLQKDASRLKKLEAFNAGSAKAVVPADDVVKANGTPVRSLQDGGIKVKTAIPAGLGFARYTMALAAANGSKMEAAEFAKRWDSSTPEVGQILKAAVSAGTTTNATWAAPLVVYQNMTSEFVEFLRPQTVLGKIQGTRSVPFNISMPEQTAGSSVGWVGQGAAKPVSALAFTQQTLGIAKAAGIVVLSEELVRSSNPSAEMIVRDDLANAMQQFLDDAVLNPTIAAVANVSPASWTNGSTYVTASGTDAAALRADILKLYKMYAAANLGLDSAVWVMKPTMALTISLMLNPLGAPYYPGMSVDGGVLAGVPVIVTNNLVQSVLAPGATPPTVVGDHISLIKANEILIADDGGVDISVSREASLQMDTAPSAGAQPLVSLWQNNMVGLRAERFINWRKRRAAAVTYISGANYVA